MLYLSFIEYKRIRKLACLFLGITFTVMIHLSQCTITDRYYLARPYSQRQFFYSLFCEDYEEGQNIEHDFLMNRGALLSTKARENLYNVITEMNPDYKQGEDIYSIDFDNIDCAILRQKVGIYVASITDGMPYLYDNWDSTYAQYCMSSPFFSKNREMNPSILADKILQQLIFSRENGYYKYNFLFGYNTECTEEEKKYIDTLIEWIEQETGDADAVLARCNAACQMIDEQMGGNTSFSADRMVFYSPGELNEATAKYYEIEDREGVASAVARVVSDYMGICAGILPILLAAFAFDDEKQNEMVLSSGISTKKYFISKYMGVSIPYFVLFIIVYVGDSIIFSWVNQIAYKLDYLLLFLSYFLCWIMPTLLFTTAMSMFLSRAFNNNTAAAFVSLMVSFLSLSVDTGSVHILQPVIRFNVFGETTIYYDLLPTILVNRLVTISLAVFLSLGTYYLVEYRRRHYR